MGSESTNKNVMELVCRDIIHMMYSDLLWRVPVKAVFSAKSASGTFLMRIYTSQTFKCKKVELLGVIKIKPSKKTRGICLQSIHPDTENASPDMNSCSCT